MLGVFWKRVLILVKNNFVQIGSLEIFSVAAQSLIGAQKFSFAGLDFLVYSIQLFTN